MSENKMTPTPWKVDEDADIIGFDETIVTPVWELKSIDASAIVSAVNNTYGCGINPEAVGALWSVVDCLIKYEDTITEAGVDLNDYYWFQSAKAAIKLAKLI